MVSFKRSRGFREALQAGFLAPGQRALNRPARFGVLTINAFAQRLKPRW